MSDTTDVQRDVLAFYQALPFNYYSSAGVQAARLRKGNGVLSRPILAELIDANMRVLDVGCGAGWLANSISYYFKARVVGIDFSSAAVERAREVAKLFGSTAEFFVADLFKYQPDSAYDLVCSEGVLHHTTNCHEAIRVLCRKCVRRNGWLYVGLYHKYGRAPFLEHFRQLQDQGMDEEILYERFAELVGPKRDPVHLRSWFRDQVLHPHETQHTMLEIHQLLVQEGMELVRSSINQFQRFDDVAELFKVEHRYRERAEERLREGKYFPGFFVFLAKKR